MLLGTTESLYLGDPDKVIPLEQERHYLLEIFTHYFPRYRDVAVDELNSFSGFRVLPQADESAFSRSRETLLLWNNVEDKKVLSIYGGKLTAYRSAAKQVMKLLSVVLTKRKPVADVCKLPLHSV